MRRFSGLTHLRMSEKGGVDFPTTP